LKNFEHFLTNFFSKRRVDYISFFFFFYYLLR